jgi:hypothetical protein
MKVFNFPYESGIATYRLHNTHLYILQQARRTQPNEKEIADGARASCLLAVFFPNPIISLL